MFCSPFSLRRFALILWLPGLCRAGWTAQNGPDEIESALRSAAALISAGSLEGAGEMAREIRNAHPDDHRPYLLSGYLAFLRGNHAEAARLLYASLDIKESTGAYRNLGLVYNSIDRSHLATIAFKRCLYLEENNPQTWALLARAHRENGLDRESEEAYRRSLEISPNHPQTWRELAELLLENGQGEEAIRLLQDAPEPVRKHPRVRLTWADLLRAAGRRDEAGRILDELVADGFAGQAVDYLAGDLRLAAGDYVGAASALEQYTAAQPGNPQGWFLLARARAALKDLEGRKQALAEYQKVKAQQSAATPEEATSTIELALQALNQGHVLKAYPLFLKASEENPLDPDVDFGIAISALGAGTPEKAILDHIRRGEEICSLNAPGWGNLGNQYFHLGDAKSAMAAWRKALLVDPDLQQAYTAVTGLTTSYIINSASRTYPDNQHWQECQKQVLRQNYPDAATQLEAMFRQIRDRPESLSLLAGIFWLQAGQIEKALMYLDPLTRSDSLGKQAVFFAGLGLLREGRYPEGLKMWASADLTWQFKIAAEEEPQGG